MRKAIVAGQFYPADKDELKKQVEKFLGSGKRENVHAAIVPHAGYMFSGKLAGKTFSLIPNKKDFIILGVNHSGIGSKVCFSLENFETPLGIVKCNISLTKRIMKKLEIEGIVVEVNEKAHQSEHSIEVQLPFLQLSQKKFEIVSIILGGLSYEDCKKIAGILSEIIVNEAIIVSSDFTHYGASYGFIPFSKDVKENLFRLDNNMTLEISKNDSKGFYSLAEKSTVCGIYGITILSEIAKIKKWQAKLIDYYTSGDISGDYSNSVGYAGIVFR